MSEQLCEFPLIIHGRFGHYECTDSTCSVRPEGHSNRLPCQWSWPYAHGRVHAGQPFPKKRCNHCRHIRRAGHPDIELTEEQRASG